MSKNVLIVDDVEFVRKTLKDLLTQLGFNVIGEATDGIEAVEKYFQLNPDLVTMDVVMPKRSGIEATREIIKDKKNAVIVMVSAMDQFHLVMEAINAGARDYIQKPFHSSEVKKVLDRAGRGEAPSIATTGPLGSQKLG